MSPLISTTRHSYLFWLLFYILTQINAIAGNSPWNAAPIIPDLKPQDVVKWQANTAQIDPQGTVIIDLRLRTEKDFTLYVDQVRFSSSRALFKGKEGPPSRSIIPASRAFKSGLAITSPKREPVTAAMIPSAE